MAVAVRAVIRHIPHGVALAGLSLSPSAHGEVWPFSVLDWRRGTSEPDWSYHGAQGPASWDELKAQYRLCAEGRAQSPIDLRPRVPAPDGRLSFHYRSSPLSLANNGRFIWGEDLAGSYLVVNERRYELTEYRFHTPSEHRIEGRGADMEIQLLHRSRSGQLAIVVVLVQAGRRPNSILYRIADHLPPPGEVYYGSQLGINPLFLMPSKRAYLSYRGSLTTPPCTEGVDWLILREPVEIDALLVQRFHRAMGSNVRPIQPTNARPVFFHRHR